MSIICPQKKVSMFLLDTFIEHLSREQIIVLRGASVWHSELACRKSLQRVCLDVRSRVANALK